MEKRINDFLLNESIIPIYGETLNDYLDPFRNSKKIKALGIQKINSCAVLKS
jgi:hypothetical protein